MAERTVASIIITATVTEEAVDCRMDGCSHNRVKPLDLDLNLGGGHVFSGQGMIVIPCSGLTTLQLL